MRLLVGVILLLGSSSAQVRRSGDLQVDLHCAIDLDAGTWECVVMLDGDGTEPPAHPAGKDDDFRLERSKGHFVLQPRNGSKLAFVASAASGFTGCTSAPYGTKSMRLDALSPLAAICVRTNQARYAQIRIAKPVSPGADRVWLSFVTWESRSN